jgi:hypothetical protein
MGQISSCLTNQRFVFNKHQVSHTEITQKLLYIEFKFLKQFVFTVN